jgi:voltage-gated potassium channel
MVSLAIYIFILLLAGTTFYSQVEQWSFIDSFYFSVTTLSTVGYGDLAPKTDAGKLFTAFYIMTGVGLLLGFLGHVASHTKESDPLLTVFKELFKRKK